MGALRGLDVVQTIREQILVKLDGELPDVWVKKDGSLIKIKDMDDAHVMNALRCSIVAASLQRARMCVFYVTCEEPNGVHAQDAFDMEADAAYDATWKDRVDRFFDALWDEARHRGLPGSTPEEINKLGEDVDARTRHMESNWIDRVEIAKLEREIDDKKSRLKELIGEHRELTERSAK